MARRKHDEFTTLHWNKAVDWVSTGMYVEKCPSGEDFLHHLWMLATECPGRLEWLIGREGGWRDALRAERQSAQDAAAVIVAAKPGRIVRFPRSSGRAPEPEASA